jgi:predicted nucleic acid-binding protein
VSRTNFLDTGPLGILTNPRRPPETVNALRWALTMSRAGHRLIVPAIADYEVRRELERAAKTAGLAAVDAWNNAAPDVYLPLSDSALRLGATLWARARHAGTATADPRELDADVLIAAQALDLGLSEFIVATVNVGHLALFVPADRWANITPQYP